MSEEGRRIVTMSPRTIAKTIRVLVQKGDATFDKAEQYYVSAGEYLKKLKAVKPDGVTWEEYVQKTCHIGIRRAQELIAISDGRTTLEKVRASKAESVRRLRALRSAPCDPQAIAENRTRSLQGEMEAGKLPPRVASWLTDHPDKTPVDYVAATPSPVGDPNAPEPPPSGLEALAEYMGLSVRGEDTIKLLKDSLDELNRIFPALNSEYRTHLIKIYGDVVVAAQNIAERLTGDRHARFQLVPGTGNGRDQTEGVSEPE